LRFLRNAVFIVIETCQLELRAILAGTFVLRRLLTYFYSAEVFWETEA
jgi:hypothetical protein